MVLDDFSLKGKIAFITGASYGIGFAIAEAYAEAGAKIVFNDINKEAYPASLPLIKEKLRTGGVLIIDNILWSGRIFDKNNKTEATKGVREFTKMVTHDSDWIVSLAPVRDGVIVAYKK